MLTADEKDRIRASVQALASAGDVTLQSLVNLLAGLPPRAEALEMTRELLAAQAPAVLADLERVVGRMRELLSAPAAVDAVPRSSLEVLLASPGPREQKVDALLAVARAGDRTATRTIRERISIETDPFVQATLASTLGQLGDKSDADVLLPLLDSSDARVVANALDALNRMEAEAPVEQVRDLIHAADHRLRLSALSLFARTDPVNALLALPPLVGENHPTLTGGIALLLGDLAAQPLATDQLLELVASEDRPQILKHIADSLKRHAELAPERKPEIVTRLITTRQASRLHKVPILTGLLESLGAKNLAPVFSEVTNAASKAPVPEPEPEPPPPPAGASTSRIQPRPPGLTAPSAKASGVLGRPADLSAPANRSGALARPADLSAPPASRSGGLPRPADLAAPSAQRSGALARPADIKAAAADEPLVKPWMWLAGGAAVLMLIAAAVGLATPSKPAPKASAAAAPVNQASPRPSIATRPAPEPSAPITGRPGSKSLGPPGAELTVEGTVVSVANHRVVVRSGEVFFSCRGKTLVEMRVGEAVKLKGKLAGVARDGMVLMTVDKT